jgi:SAM-dependent methyltransferase
MLNGALERGLDVYRRGIFAILKPLLSSKQPIATALDFGSGDGWFAQQFVTEGLLANVTAVDVHDREHFLVRPVIFDGRRLPFSDRSFDLVYAVDVLHHCEDPRASLREMIRCSARFLVIKDHTYRNILGRLSLGILDEIGNRRFGIPSLYHYQRAWEWFPWIEQAGFKLRTLVHPAPCHGGIYGWASNHLHFVAVWERQDAST